LSYAAFYSFKLKTVCETKVWIPDCISAH